MVVFLIEPVSSGKTEAVVKAEEELKKEMELKSQTKAW